MGYSHTRRRSRLIWDGAEDGMLNNVFEYTCPSCNKTGQFTFRDAAELSKHPDTLCTFLIDENIVSYTERKYEIKKDTQAYVISLNCGDCHSEIWLIVGIKEVQPQRYKCYLKSVICEKEG